MYQNKGTLYNSLVTTKVSLFYQKVSGTFSDKEKQHKAKLNRMKTKAKTNKKIAYCNDADVR